MGFKVLSLSWKSLVFGISFLYTLVFTIIFGFQGKSVEMGLVLATGVFAMAIPHLDKIVRIKGAGIELETRVDEKIDELKELEIRLKKQEKELSDLNDYMSYALITAFRDIGVLHIENQKYVFAVDISLMAVQLYAYCPKEINQSTVDAILSGMTGWLSEGTPMREPIAKLLKEKGDIVLDDYVTMKKNNAPHAIVEKCEKVMSKVGIGFKKD
jgi:hypothetical protein